MSDYSLDEVDDAQAEGQQAQAAAATTPNNANDGMTPAEVAQDGEQPQQADPVGEMQLGMQQTQTAADPAALNTAKQKLADLEGGQNQDAVVRGAYTEARANQTTAEVEAENKQKAENEETIALKAEATKKLIEDNEYVQSEMRKGAELRDKANALFDISEKQSKELQGMKAPHRGVSEWFHESPVNMAVGFVGSLLGGLAGGIARDGSNAFMETLEKRLDKEAQMQLFAIEKKKDDLANNRFMINDYLKAGMDKIQATQAFKVAALDAFHSRVEALGSRITDATKANAIAQATARIAQRKTAMAQDLIKNVTAPILAQETKTLTSAIQLANASRQSESQGLREGMLGARERRDMSNFELRAQKQFEQGGGPDVQTSKKRLVAVENALAFQKQYPNPNDMPQGQYEELVGELAQVASGAVGSNALRSSLSAKTFISETQKFLSKVGNSPTKAQLGAFIKEHYKYLRLLKMDFEKTVDNHEKSVLETMKGNPLARKEFIKALEGTSRKARRAEEGE